MSSSPSTSAKPYSAIAADRPTGVTAPQTRMAPSMARGLPSFFTNVFTAGNGSPLQPGRVGRAFQSALEAAGLPRQPFHHLRHAYATLQLEGGEELANVSKVLGHADLSTTANLYAHLTPAIARRAADRMDSILAG
jgi:integrase